MKKIVYSLILSLGILNANSVDFAKAEDDIKICYLGGGYFEFKCINGVVYSWWGKGGWGEGATVILNQDGKPVKCSCEKEGD